MEFIESELKEVSADEFSEKAKEAELVININYSGKSAAVSVSSDFVFFELFEPRKFYMGKKKDVDYKKMIKENVEKVKKEMEEKGITPFTILKKGG